MTRGTRPNGSDETYKASQRESSITCAICGRIGWRGFVTYKEPGKPVTFQCVSKSQCLRRVRESK